METLKRKVSEYQGKINALQTTLESMRVSIRNIVGSEQNPGNAAGPRRKDKFKIYENDSYFSSYSHFGIHHEMLSDTVRTLAYQKAIVENKEVFNGKSVIDIGCGTGILSMFAATAGAKHVLAIDESDMAFYAMAIITENKLTQPIEVVKKKVEHMDGSKKFDIIVSEWMGYFLVFEGMLDTILYARENLLNPGGIILPNRCTLTIAGICDQKFYNKHFHFWEDVYGYKMNSLKHECILEAIIDVVDPANVCTDHCQVKAIDVMTCTLEETQLFESEFSLSCTTPNTTIHAICGWFECFFDTVPLIEKVSLPTSPYTKPTHWKQTLFLLKTPVELKETGDLFEGRIIVARMENNARALRVEFAFRNGEKQEYFMM